MWQAVLPLGILFIVVGHVFPSMLKSLQKAWLAVGIIMGWVMTVVILTLLFYLVVTPIGLVMRLLGKRPLDIEFPEGDSKKTFWNYRENRELDPSQLERQY